MENSRCLIPVLMFAVLCGCAGSSDRTYERLIVGEWQDSTFATVAASSSRYTFKANGEMEIRFGRDVPLVRDVIDSKNDPNFVPAESGTWEIENGWLAYRVTKSNFRDVPTTLFRYQINELTGDKLEFDTANGRETYFRTKE